MRGFGKLIPSTPLDKTPLITIGELGKELGLPTKQEDLTARLKGLILQQPVMLFMKVRVVMLPPTHHTPYIHRAIQMPPGAGLVSRWWQRCKRLVCRLGPLTY